MRSAGVQLEAPAPVTLTIEDIAERFAILPETAVALSRKLIFPPPDAGEGRWHATTIDNIIERIHREGLPAGSPLLPYTHAVQRLLTIGIKRQHPGWRHGKQSKRIKHPPRSPEFVRAWFKHERDLAAQQQPTGQRASAPPIAPAAHPKKHSHTAPKQRRKSPPLASGQSQTKAAPAAQPSGQPAAATAKVVTQKVASRTAGRPRTPAELVAKMQRRRAAVMQADIARIIRAAKQAGAAQVEVRLNDSSTVVVRLQPENSLASDEEIIL
jgi:hypothetical protein